MSTPRACIIGAGSSGIVAAKVLKEHGVPLQYTLEDLDQDRSGGLAGGDHLHFSILVNDTFVNPVEWWDKKWIQNNVQRSSIGEVGHILHGKNS